MELWRKVWREMAAHISLAGLKALEAALITDDVRLIQGNTCWPPPLLHCDVEVGAACAVSFCGWQGDGLQTVAEVEEYFGDTTQAVDAEFNEPAMSRYFLNWYDDTPRDVMRREMLA